MNKKLIEEIVDMSMPLLNLFFCYTKIVKHLISIICKIFIFAHYLFYKFNLKINSQYFQNIDNI